MKTRLDFEPDDWLVTDLETFKTQHPELDFKKDILQNYIRSLKDKIVSLEATLQYQSDMAGKSAEAPLNSSFNQNSSTAPTEKESRPTSEPEILARADTVQLVTIKGKAYRIRDSQADSAIWQDGEWTFSRKKVEALVFATEVLAVRNDKTRELMTIKAEGQKEIERIKTAGANDRAKIRRGNQRQYGEGQVFDNSPHGAPAADMVV